MLADFSSFVKSDHAVASLIAGRMSPGVLPEASPLPAITYSIQDAQRDHYLSGQFDGFNHPSLEVECWGVSAADALELAQAVIAAIDGHTGAMGSIEVSGILVENQSDRTRLVYGDRRQYCHVLDVTVIYIG